MKYKIDLLLHRYDGLNSYLFYFNLKSISYSIGKKLCRMMHCFTDLWSGFICFILIIGKALLSINNMFICICCLTAPHIKYIYNYVSEKNKGISIRYQLLATTIDITHIVTNLSLTITLWLTQQYHVWL